MLVLTRNLNESIEFDGGITVTILESRGKRVKVGIEAPKSIGIRRTNDGGPRTLPLHGARRRPVKVA